MNPITTDGIPDRSSIIGFSVSLTAAGATSARYAAQATPTGTAIAVATTVTHSVATKKDVMPKVGGSETGYHFVPNRNSQGGV
jgi:hypothetical protein